MDDARNEQPASAVIPGGDPGPTVTTPLSGITAAGASRFTRDLTERTVWTFAQTFGATLVASGWFSMAGITDLPILQKAAVAGIAAVLAVVKGLVASQVGQTGSASTAPGI
jgi:hypothetical protein